MTTLRDAPRLRGWRARIVWIVFGLDIAMMLGAWLVAGAGPDAPAFAPLLFTAMVASLGGVGALVGTRKPRDPVGWILFASASIISLSVLGQDYVRLSLADPSGTFPLTTAVAWIYNLLFMPSVVLIAGVMPLYFPDGRLPSPRWRWAVWLAALGIVVVSLPPAFDAGPILDTPLDNPFGIPGFHELDGLLALSNLVIAVVVLPLAIASSVLKYRRGSPVVREQLKWFAAVGLFTVTSFCVAVPQIAPISDIGWLFGLLGLIALPIAIGIAILRYHLYEIDRIISRTISWTLTTGVIAAVFAGIVIGLQGILGQVTGGSTVAIAGSTLVAFATFQPLRRRVQGAVDRRFNRARYDAQRTVDGFAEQLRYDVDLPTLRSALVTTADGAVRPISSSIWLRTATVPGK
jgi:hypothetical protein